MWLLHTIELDAGDTVMTATISVPALKDLVL